MTANAEFPMCLLLSEEETFAILDLCLTSTVEPDAVQERVMLKVTELARRYMAGSGSLKLSASPISVEVQDDTDVAESVTTVTGRTRNSPSRRHGRTGRKCALNLVK